MKTAYMHKEQNTLGESIWHLDPPPVNDATEVVVREKDDFIEILCNCGCAEVLWHSNTTEGAAEALERWAGYTPASLDYRVSIRRPMLNGDTDIMEVDESGFELAILHWFDILGVGNRAAARELRLLADAIEAL